MKMNDLVSREVALRNDIREKDAQIDAMHQGQREMLDLLHQLSYKISTLTEGNLQAAAGRKLSSAQDTLPPAAFSRKASIYHTNTNINVAQSPPPPFTGPTWVYDQSPLAAPSSEPVDGLNEKVSCSSKAIP